MMITGETIVFNTPDATASYSLSRTESASGAYTGHYSLNRTESAST